MILDFHTHCYPEQLAARAVSIVPPHLPAPAYDGTLSGLKKSMQLNGIDRSVVLHIANKPENTCRVNDWAIFCNQESNIFSFGSIHPLYDDFKREIARLKEAGIKGLKFHPCYQHYEINDSVAYRVYEEAAKAGMIILFHTGLDGIIPGNNASCDKFAAVIDDLKYEKIVGAHLGGSLMFKDAAEMIWGKNIYIDMSLSFRFLSGEFRARLKDTHDTEKLLFGSDGPWTTPKIDFAEINNFFSSEEKELIYYKNAVKLLEI